MSQLFKSESSYYVGSLITSVIAAVLLLFTDFAAWEHYDYYNGIFSAGWVGGEAFIYLIIIISVAICLFFTAFISYLGMKAVEGRPTKIEVRSGLITSLVAFGMIMVSALIFLVVILSDEPDYWWYGPGFYGGAIGSALSSFFLFSVYKDFKGPTGTDSGFALNYDLNWQKIILGLIAVCIIIFLIVFFTSEAFFEILEEMGLF